MTSAAEASENYWLTRECIDCRRVGIGDVDGVQNCCAARPGWRSTEVHEDGSSIAGRLVWLAARCSIRPGLAVASYFPKVPWPFGMLDFAARALAPEPGTVRASILLPHCDAVLVRAPGVLPADGSRRVVLYMHGGAFMMCGSNTHGRLVGELSKYADAPVLVINYRLIPRHSIDDAVNDCFDGYQWLRREGYAAAQIVLAGDSAGGYLTLALAERLLAAGEQPAALVAMSPLLQLATAPKLAHPNLDTDAMLTSKALTAFADLVDSASRPTGTGCQSDVFEPLDHIEPGLPPTLIHVSGSEVLLHDAQLAARALAAAGVPVQLRVWPGQVHVFQLATPVVPEAMRSLRQIGEYIREATDARMRASRVGDIGGVRRLLSWRWSRSPRGGGS